MCNPKAILAREESVDQDRQLCRSIAKKRQLSLEFSQHKIIASAHRGGVTWFDLDPIQHRYLLAVAADASIAAYDTRQPTGNAYATLHKPLFTITKQSSPAAHKFSVTSVAWYPIDAGLFVTGGFDCKVKVWDANSLAVAASFGLTDKVNAVAMSPISTTHCLVAAAGAQPQVKLCDITTGGFTHTLSGHRAAVWALHWSPVHEHQLISGGCDGQLLVWDVRRAGALHAFDMHQTKPLPASIYNNDNTYEDMKYTTTSYNHNQDMDTSTGIGTDGIGSTTTTTAPAASGSSRLKDADIGNLAHQRLVHGSAPRPPTQGAAFASAHDSAISGIVPTPDGLFWLSAGTDDKIRLWDATTKRNLLVHYPNAFNRAVKSRQIAVSGDGGSSSGGGGGVLFQPSGSVVQMYDVQSGLELGRLKGGHYESINCCRWNPVLRELYSGGNDNNIIIWTPHEGDDKHVEAIAEDKDDWSD